MIIERKFITGLIASTDYIKMVKPHWRDDLIESPDMRRIAGWCLDYFETYKKAPRQDIELLYVRGKDAVPKAEALIIADVLETINTEWEESNGAIVNDAKFLFDETIDFFRKRSIGVHIEQAQDLYQQGKLDEAEAAFHSFRSSSVPQWSRADQIQPRPISWLWKDVILRGDITLLAGRPKTGKSQVTMSVAAIASTGAPWPAGDADGRRPRDVIIMSAEDAADYVIVPRLIANGANLERIYILDAAEDTEKACVRIEACLDELPHGGVGALVIIDPISSFMPGKDSNQISHVRAALKPLSDMARMRKVGLIVVHHLRKGIDGDALDAVNGTIGFAAAARTINLVLPDPNRDGRRLLLSAGGNLAPPHPGYAFQIVPEAIREDIKITRVAWEGTPVNSTADDVMEATRKARSKPKQTQAAEWLREQLRAGAQPQTKLEADALEADISWSTIRIVKNEIGVKTFRQGGRRGAWMWTLKTDDDETENEIKSEAATTLFH